MIDQRTKPSWRSCDFLGVRVGRLRLRGSAENWARMNDFQAKSAFIIKRYAIVLETLELATLNLLITSIYAKVSSYIILSVCE